MSRKRTSDAIGLPQIAEEYYTEEKLEEEDMVGDVVYTLSGEPFQILNIRAPTFIYKKGSITSACQALESKSDVQ